MADFETVTYSPRQYAWDYESYDKAAARLCNVMRLTDAAGLPTDRPIPLVFATPERAWAVMRKKFEKNILEDRDFRIPLPFLSIQQIGETVFDPRRYLYRKVLYRKVALNTTDYTSALAHAHPLPFTFQYSVEVWTKTRYEARMAIGQFASLWEEGGMAFRQVDHGTPMGVKWVPFFLEGISDNTNLEPVESQRSLRWTLTFRVEGWLPPTPIEQKLVHKINVNVEAPENLCSPDDPYEDSTLESYYPVAQGNPETGEIVEGDQSFDDDYTGTDYRTSRFSTGNPCLSL